MDFLRVSNMCVVLRGMNIFSLKHICMGFTPRADDIHNVLPGSRRDVQLGEVFIRWLYLCEEKRELNGTPERIENKREQDWRDTFVKFPHLLCFFGEEGEETRKRFFLRWDLSVQDIQIWIGWMAHLANSSEETIQLSFEVSGDARDVSHYANNYSVELEKEVQRPKKDGRLERATSVCSRRSKINLPSYISPDTIWSSRTARTRRIGHLPKLLPETHVDRQRAERKRAEISLLEQTWI